MLDDDDLRTAESEELDCYRCTSHATKKRAAATDRRQAPARGGAIVHPLTPTINQSISHPLGSSHLQVMADIGLPSPRNHQQGVDINHQPSTALQKPRKRGFHPDQGLFTCQPAYICMPYSTPSRDCGVSNETSGLLTKAQSTSA